MFVPASLGGGRQEPREPLHNVAIDYLAKRKLAVVCNQVETLRLDAGRLHGLPFQVIACKLCVRCGLGLLGDRLYRARSVDGLLRAGDVGQSGR